MGRICVPVYMCVGRSMIRKVPERGVLQCAVGEKDEVKILKSRYLSTCWLKVGIWSLDVVAGRD